MSAARTFFTSDTHFGHERMVRDRAFATVDEMDDAIVRAWSAVVGPNDDIWHLGDLSFAKPARTAKILERLPGRKHWLLGNHDKPNVAIRNMFVSVGEYQELTIRDGTDVFKFVAMHYPLEAWNKGHYGAIHVHGHCHGYLDAKSAARRLRRFDVGVDAMPDLRYAQNVAPLAPWPAHALIGLAEGLAAMEHHAP